MIGLKRETHRIDFAGINSAAMSALPSLLSRWLPGGKRHGREYFARNPNRDDRAAGSFAVNLVTGRWSDFATGDKGGDPISLTAYLHNIPQGEAARRLAEMLGIEDFNLMEAANPFEPLSAKERATSFGGRTSDETWIPITPVPETAPKAKEAVLRLCPPGFIFTSNWRYCDDHGRLMFWAVRYDKPGNGVAAEKQFRPFSYCSGPNGAVEWRLKAVAVDRPLYGLDKLTARPSAPVLVVEGGKSAEAAAVRFADYVVTTSSGGARAAAKTDWSPLRGRDITIWPDNDGPGTAYADEVDGLLHQTGAQSVARIASVAGWPDGWDLADNLPAGVDDAELRRMLETATKSNDGLLPLFPPLPSAEPYPVSYLGSCLTKASAAIARKVQVPHAIAAQSVLAVAALAAQAHVDVKLPYGQTRPISLNFVTIAASGDRKSSADNEALWPIRKREKTLKEEHETAMEGWRVDHGAWNAEKRKIEANNKMDQSQRKCAFRDLGPEPERPLHPILTAPDPTVEGLAKAWVNAPASLGIFTAEGGMFVGGHGMSDEAKLRTAATYSELWDGKPVKRIRAIDGVTLLHGRRLAMHVMVQPSAAAIFLADATLRDQGLLSRMLVAAPDSIAGNRLYRDTAPEDDLAIKAYGARILSLLEDRWPLVEGKSNELEPRELSMSARAAETWKTFFNHIERQSGKGGELAAIPDFAAKAAEHAARLAAVITIVEDIHAFEIDDGAMQCGVALVDWYVAEALRLQRGARADVRLLRAADLLAWLQSRGREQIGFREILQFGPSATRTKEAAEATIEVLAKHGWVSEVSKRPSPAGRHGGERLMAYRRFKLTSAGQAPATLAILATVHDPNRRSVANVASVADPSAEYLGLSPWWNDLSEVQARFDETAGIREFDSGLSRLDAEAVALDCLLTELQHAGLTLAEARGVIESARNRQRMMRH